MSPHSFGKFHQNIFSQLNIQTAKVQVGEVIRKQEDPVIIQFYIKYDTDDVWAVKYDIQF